MIRDLEAVLLTIPDRGSREFMREAVLCHHGGAYRAAVVIAVAAGMDDLRKKLEHQAAAGGAPAGVTAAHQKVDALFKKQEAFERTLIDACEQQANYFSPGEAKKMRLLLDLRHLCAHPSGHRSSAEEAREAICSITDLVLARTGQLGMAGVTHIMDRLDGPLFFPNPDRVADTVRGELATLQPALLRAVTTRLIDKLLRAAAAIAANPANLLLGGHSNERVQARRFLLGMISLGGEARDSVWAYAGKIIEASAATEDALELMAADPMAIQSQPPLVRERAIALVRRALGSKHGRLVAKAWRAADAMTAEELADLEAAAVQTLVGSLRTTDSAAIAELGWTAVEEQFFARAVEDAGSTSFDTSNAAVDAIQAMPREMADRLSPAARAQYVLQVARSSEGAAYYGRSARRALENGLGARATFIDSLRAEIGRDPAAMRANKTMWSELAKLLERAGRRDALADVLGMFEGHEEHHTSEARSLAEFCTNIPELAPQAQRVLAAVERLREAQGAALF